MHEHHHKNCQNLQKNTKSSRSDAITCSLQGVIFADCETYRRAHDKLRDEPGPFYGTRQGLETHQKGVQQRGKTFKTWLVCHTPALLPVCFLTTGVQL